MSKNTDSKFDFSKFDADPELSDQRNISVPPPTGQVNIEQRPFGFTPMGEVETDRQAYGALAQGRARWWVIITSWFVIALPASALGGWTLYNLLQGLFSRSNDPIMTGVMLVLSGAILFMTSLPVLIVFRATRAKFRHDRQQKIRRWVTAPHHGRKSR